MKVSRKWIDWAHGPAAESEHPLAMRLCELLSAPGKGCLEVTDAELIEELVSQAEVYENPSSGDALYEMGPWWMGQPAKVVREGREALRVIKARAKN